MKKILNFIDDIIKITLFIIVFNKLFEIFLYSSSDGIKNILSSIIIIIIKGDYKEDTDIWKFLKTPFEITIARTLIDFAPYLIKFFT